jgi:hypothetical protein
MKILAFSDLLPNESCGSNYCTKDFLSMILGGFRMKHKILEKSGVNFIVYPGFLFRHVTLK